MATHDEPPEVTRQHSVLSSINLLYYLRGTMLTVTISRTHHLHKACLFQYFYWAHLALTPVFSRNSTALVRLRSKN